MLHLRMLCRSTLARRPPRHLSLDSLHNRTRTQHHRLLVRQWDTLLTRLRNRILTSRAMPGSLQLFPSARRNISASTLELSTQELSQYEANSQQVPLPQTTVVNHRARVVKKTTKVVTTNHQVPRLIHTVVSHKATVVKKTTTVVTLRPTMVSLDTTVARRTSRVHLDTGKVAR